MEPAQIALMVALAGLISAVASSAAFLLERSAPTRKQPRPSLPSGLAYSTNGVYAVGIELLPYKLAAALVSNSGERLAEREAELVDMDDAITVARAMADVAQELAKSAPGEAVIGVQLGGPVDADSGLVHVYGKKMPRPSPGSDGFAWKYFEWKDFNLGEWMRAATEREVVIENDANAYAVREQWFGVGDTTTDFAVVLTREGIGGSIVTEGRLFTGPVEIGNFIIPDSKRAALEDVAGVTSILRSVNEDALPTSRTSAVFDVGDITTAIDRADEDDPFGAHVVEVFRAAGTGVASAIGYLMNFAGPSHVVLYVPRVMCKGGRRAVDAFHEEANRYRDNVRFEFLRDCELIVRPLRTYDGAEAAALVALERCYNARPTSILQEQIR